MQEQNGAPAIVVRWRSFELRPAGSPPMPAEYRERIEASRPQLYATARERYGRELNVGPFGINSRLALIGEKYAEQQGLGEPFHAGVMVAYWSGARDISDRNVLAEVAATGGLDRDAFLVALDDPRYDRMVQEDIDLAQRYGLNSVPALVFDNTYLVSGAQPVEVLRQVVARIRET
jgi:predicted DsbA family dithiol-disulfide isomerase